MSEPEFIRMQHISHAYRTGPQQINALTDVSLIISRGEYVAVTGRSGSGKSTLLHIMGGLLKPTDGSYMLFNQDMVNLNKAKLATIRNEFIGFVFQNFNLLPRTNALNNVALPLIYSGAKRGERSNRAQDLLQRVGLGDRIRHRPSQLSGGEQQRVAIARALVNHPRLLLADEPTGNLDSNTGHKIIELFEKLVEEGITVIFVSHDQDIVKRASRKINLMDSRLV